MVKYTVNPDLKKSKISKEIYGHFSEHLGRCIYEGIYVGKDSPVPNVNGIRSDVVEALKEIRVPVLRWPGGCFADEYHWKDGIGPAEKRKKMINTHWGGGVEDNRFGTHEFFELCRQLECKAYVNGNLGSGTVQEMSEWVEYMTMDGMSPMADLRKENGHESPWEVTFFGVGNENWGCGGNMTPEHYANEYRRYQTYVRNYSNDRKICKIACGANSDDYEWTEGVLSTCFAHTDPSKHGFMDGLSLHYYTHLNGCGCRGSATEFDENDWYRTLRNTLYMEELIREHGKIMDKYDPEKKIGMIVDEWGTWYDAEPGTNPAFLYQQNTMRDAIVAGINLNIFNKNCDRVRMANLAQMVNVLQAVILTEGEKMLRTPTYHVFNMYKYHQDSMLVESHIDTEIVGKECGCPIPNFTESASVDQNGILHLTITNLSLEKEYEVETSISGMKISEYDGEILAGEMHAMNTFEDPEHVHVCRFTDIEIEDNKLRFSIPACSILHLTVKK